MLKRLGCCVQSLFRSKCLATQILRWTVTLGVLTISIWFIAKKTYSEYITISTSSINPDIYKLLISWLCVTASTFLGAWEWTLLVKALGGSLDTVTGMHIHLISGLGKYIPGYIWPYLSKTHLAVRYGVPANIAIFSVAGELVMVYLSGILILLSSLPLSSLIQRVQTMPVNEFVAGFFPVAFMTGSLINNHLSKLLEHTKTIDWKSIVFIIVLMSLTWYLLGIGFYMLDASIEPLTENVWTLITGMIIAMLGGQLALFVPMGVGVREAIFVAILNTEKPAWLVILMAVVFRLETTLGDIVSFLVMTIWSKIAKKAHIPLKGNCH